MSDMKEIEISIITPAYNCKNTIKETFDSVISQSFSLWEWIIVEDCSTDGSFEFIKELSKIDDRIVVLQTPKNSGAAAARNIGIEKAKGRFIAFLDSDDLWLPNKLEQQLQFMKENNYAISYTCYNVLTKNGKIKVFSPKRDRVDYKTLLKRCDIGCSTVIYDSLLLGKVFMPLDCIKREDYGTWLDITRQGVIAYKLNELLSIYRLSSDSVSSNKFKIIKYQYNVYKKHEKIGFIKSVLYLIIHSINRVFKYL